MNNASNLPVNMPLADGKLETGNDVGPNVWLNRATAIECAEKRFVELVEVFSRFEAGSGSQVEGIGKDQANAVEGLDQCICVGLGNGHGGAPVKAESVGAP